MLGVICLWTTGYWAKFITEVFYEGGIGGVTNLAVM